MVVKKKAGAEKSEKPKKEKEGIGKELGRVTHFFDKVGVAVVEIAKAVNVGDKIRIKGMTTNFEQLIDSMQIEHKEIKKAKKGDAIGMKVKDRVRPNDKVYLAD